MFSAMPSSCSLSMTSRDFTSSSRASTLIRILLISSRRFVFTACLYPLLRADAPTPLLLVLRPIPPQGPLQPRGWLQPVRLSYQREQLLLFRRGLRQKLPQGLPPQLRQEFLPEL